LRGIVFSLIFGILIIGLVGFVPAGFSQISDADKDGITDFLDNCPKTSNKDQTDTDKDGKGDACDTDDDNDKIPDSSDKCPLKPENYNGYQDTDGCPDTAPADYDKDGIPDSQDCMCSSFSVWYSRLGAQIIGFIIAGIL